MIWNTRSLIRIMCTKRGPFSTSNCLCVALRKIYDYRIYHGAPILHWDIVIAHPCHIAHRSYYIAHSSYNTPILPRHIVPKSFYGCMSAFSWKSPVKKELPRFFCGNPDLAVLCFVAQKYSANNFFMMRLVDTRHHFQHFYRFQEILLFAWCAFCLLSFLYIHTLPNKSVGNIYHFFSFLFYIQNRVILLSQKKVWVVFCRENLF